MCSMYKQYTIISQMISNDINIFITYYFEHYVACDLQSS